LTETPQTLLATSNVALEVNSVQMVEANDAGIQTNEASDIINLESKTLPKRANLIEISLFDQAA
jgi:hypothetical protein